MKIYTYKKCGTCQKAIKWLNNNNISYEELPIRETPPSLDELKAVLSTYQGQIGKLFNTSGKDYRDGNYKTKIKEMTEEEILDELSSNGNLIKRPFVMKEDGSGIVGFKEDLWSDFFQK